MKKYNEGVLLDTSFVIANQLISEQLHERTIDIISELVQGGRTCLLTPLVMDEFWHVIKRALREVIPPNRSKDVNARVVSVTKLLLSANWVTLANPVFKKSDLMEVPDIMSKYDLRPRDALLVKTMEILGIKDIASFDTDFARVKTINVIK